MQLLVGQVEFIGAAASHRGALKLVVDDPMRGFPAASCRQSTKINASKFFQRRRHARTVRDPPRPA
jgi:hypothetical protein